MKRTVCLLLCLGLCLTLQAATITFGQGRCRVSEQGEIILEAPNGETCRVALCAVIPKWLFCTSLEQGTVTIRQHADHELTMKGQLKAGKARLPLGIQLKADGQRLVMKVTCVTPKHVVFQDHLPLQLHLSGSYATYPEGLLRLGNSSQACLITDNNRWGYGDVQYLAPLQLEVRTEPGRTSSSFWSSAASKTWNLRINGAFTECEDGRRYDFRAIFSPKTLRLRKPIDLVSVKRQVYRRVLCPPAEPQFQPRRLRELLADPELNLPKLSRLEGLLDARSLLYAHQDALNHCPQPTSVQTEILAQAWKALNDGDLDRVRALFPRLKQAFSDSGSWMPLSGFSPLSWIKSFTWQGFMKHPEGVLVSEPNPWCVLWQDGLRLALARHENVTLASTYSVEPGFFETRFLKPLKDVTVERSWTGTTWHLPTGKVTFSVLTPIIYVEGIQSLSLSNLSSAPRRLGYVTPSGLQAGVSFSSGRPWKPEVIASAIMDHQARPADSGTSPVSQDSFALDPEQVGRPWLSLDGVGGWRLILLPGARPVGVSYEKNVFTLKLSRKSYVGILRLPPNVHFRELPLFGEFFAPIAAAFPCRCWEKVHGDRVTWSYEHRLQPNDWQLKPLPIAPVPPLAALADLAVPGTKTIPFPTKYGNFRYAEGRQVSVTLPRSFPRQPLLRGVNVWLDDDFEVYLQHKRHGAQWQRLAIGTSERPEEHFQRYEQALAFGVRHGIRFLVDPHNFLYKVSWSTGFPADGKREQAFLRLWDRLSNIGARYPQAIAGYDLYNELGVKEGAEARWKTIADRCCAIIRRNHPQAAIYVTGLDGANPSGLFNVLPSEVDKLVTSFHFYTPHSFTHQKSSTRWDNDPYVFYPAYVPHIDWRAGIHYGGTNVEWFDRWTLAACLLPSFETYVRLNRPLHCGEFSVIGYANGKAEESAFLWTRDAVELMEHCGTSWNLWNGGFGLGNRHVRRYMHDLWQGGTN